MRRLSLAVFLLLAALFLSPARADFISDDFRNQIVTVSTGLPVSPLSDQYWEVDDGSGNVVATSLNTVGFSVEDGAGLKAVNLSGGDNVYAFTHCFVVVFPSTGFPPGRYSVVVVQSEGELGESYTVNAYHFPISVIEVQRPYMAWGGSPDPNPPTVQDLLGNLSPTLPTGAGIQLETRNTSGGTAHVTFSNGDHDAATVDSAGIARSDTTWSPGTSQAVISVNASFADGGYAIGSCSFALPLNCFTNVTNGIAGVTEVGGAGTASTNGTNTNNGGANNGGANNGGVQNNGGANNGGANNGGANNGGTQNNGGANNGGTQNNGGANNGGANNGGTNNNNIGGVQNNGGTNNGPPGGGTNDYPGGGTNNGPPGGGTNNYPGGGTNNGPPGGGTNNGYPGGNTTGNNTCGPTGANGTSVGPTDNPNPAVPCGSLPPNAPPAAPADSDPEPVIAPNNVHFCPGAVVNFYGHRAAGGNPVWSCIYGTISAAGVYTYRGTATGSEQSNDLIFASWAAVPAQTDDHGNVTQPAIPFQWAVAAVVFDSSICAKNGELNNVPIVPADPGDGSAPCKATGGFPGITFSPYAKFYNWPVELIQNLFAVAQWLVIPQPCASAKLTQDVTTYFTSGVFALPHELQSAVQNARACGDDGPDKFAFWLLSDFANGGCPARGTYGVSPAVASPHAISARAAQSLERERSRPLIVPNPGLSSQAMGSASAGGADAFTLDGSMGGHGAPNPVFPNVLDLSGLHVPIAVARVCMTVVAWILFMMRLYRLFLSKIGAFVPHVRGGGGDGSWGRSASDDD